MSFAFVMQKCVHYFIFLCLNQPTSVEEQGVDCKYDLYLILPICLPISMTPLALKKKLKWDPLITKEQTCFLK